MCIGDSHRECHLPPRSRLGVQYHFDLASLGKLHGVADQIEQDLVLRGLLAVLELNTAKLAV